MYLIHARSRLNARYLGCGTFTPPTHVGFPEFPVHEGDKDVEEKSYDVPFTLKVAECVDTKSKEAALYKVELLSG